MIKTFNILLLISLNISVYCQKIDDFLKGHDCQFLYFETESTLKYRLDFSYHGALKTYNQGKCKYSILNDSILTLSITENSFDFNPFQYSDNIDCPELKDIKSQDYQFELIKIETDVFILIGPILHDYQKLNRKRFIRGFLNWPLRWSFRKQHWYDPIWREFVLTGANSAYRK